MKIESYKKKTSNIYEITLSNNEKISLYDDVILKYELLIKKEIDDQLKEKIYEENSYLECYYKAVKYLNTKLRTEKEIRKKLADYNNKIVDYTIRRLYDEGYINNSMYIKAYINDEVNFKLIGPNKILKDLMQKGYKNEEVTNYLDTIDKCIWDNKINKFISKKIQSNHKLSGQILKQKIYQDLLLKGFEKQSINNNIEDFEFDDDKAIYEKEYSKIKNKLSKKYSNDELIYRINIELRKKGFKKDLD